VKAVSNEPLMKILYQAKPEQHLISSTWQTASLYARHCSTGHGQKCMESKNGHHFEKQLFDCKYDSHGPSNTNDVSGTQLFKTLKSFRKLQVQSMTVNDSL